MKLENAKQIHKLWTRLLFLQEDLERWENIQSKPIKENNALKFYVGYVDNNSIEENIRKRIEAKKQFLLESAAEKLTQYAIYEYLTAIKETKSEIENVNDAK